MDAAPERLRPRPGQAPQTPLARQSSPHSVDGRGGGGLHSRGGDATMPAKFSTHHIADEGIRFTAGDVVSLVHATGRTQIIKDPSGEYEVTGCRPATEYADSLLLRVDLKKPDREPPVQATP